MAKPVKIPVEKTEAEGGLLPAFFLLGLWLLFLLVPDTQLLDAKRAAGFAWAAWALAWLGWRAWKGQASDLPPKGLAVAGAAIALSYGAAWALSPYAGVGGFRVEELSLAALVALSAACLPTAFAERWPAMTITAAALIAGYALAQRLGLDPSFALRAQGSALRASGTFGNPNFLAAFLVFAWPLALLWHDQRRPLLFLWLLLALLATQSRAGAVALVAQLAVLALQAWREGLRPRWGLGIAVGAAAILAGLWLFPAGQWSRPTLRVPLWAGSLQLVAQRPLAGWGPGAFPLAIKDHASGVLAQLAESGQFAEHPHNFILGILVEAGFLGLLAWSFLFAWAGPWPRQNALRSPLQRAVALGLLGLLVENLFDRNLDQASLGVCLFLGLGLVSRRATPQPRTWPRASAVFLGALALACLWLGWQPLQAYHDAVLPPPAQLDSSEVGELKGLARADPQDAGAWDRLGAALAAQASFVEAKEAYDNAFRLQASPGRAQNIGNCEMELGRPKEAEAEYRMALLLATKPSADLHFSLGYALFKQGKLQEAVEALNAALKLEPRHAAALKLKEQILR